jgi:hypothetical protein
MFEEIGYEFEDGVNPFPTVHHNLCGQLAVMEALGVSLEEGFEVFAGMGDRYQGILKDSSREVYGTELQYLFAAFNRYADVRVGDNELDQDIIAGNKVIALVTIKNGVLHEQGNTAHWVHVKTYGSSTVTFYNPFINETETLPRELFDAAWQSTPGNTGEYVKVVASP